MLQTVLTFYDKFAEQNDTNPHLKYADTNSYGFALVAIDATKAEVTFVELGDPLQESYGGVVGRKRFVTNVGTNKVTKL